MATTRRLGWIVLLLAGLLAVTAQARTLTSLEKLAATDLLPEVRAAAGRALAVLWVEAPLSDEALRERATGGASPELRTAAAEALAARTVTEALPPETLEALAATDPLAPVRRRAGELLGAFFLEDPPPLEALERLAREGATPELRAAAVAALARAWSEAGPSTEALLERANAGATPQLRAAAARAVLARLAGALAEKATSELQDALVGAPLTFPRRAGSVELQAAAAAALAPELQAMPLTALEALVADPGRTPELRAVAGEVLGRRLLSAGRSREALERLAREGATPELRAAAVAGLVQALVQAVGAGELTVQELAAGVLSAESEALAQARAEAVFTLLRPHLIFLSDQPLLEAVLRGEVVEIGGVTVDGRNVAFRRAAGAFLAGLFRQFGGVNRFQDPIAELLALAGDPSLTPEHRAAAGSALEKFLSAQRSVALEVIAALKRGLDRLVIQGRRGQEEEAFATLEGLRALLEENAELISTTADAAGDLGVPQRLRTVKELLARFPAAIRAGSAPELRDLSASAKAELVQIEVSLAEAPDTSTETLLELAARGATAEVRAAAGAVLARRWQRAWEAGELTFEALWRLALEGASPEVQAATVPALSAALATSELDEATLLNEAVQGLTAARRRAAAAAWVQRQAPAPEALLALADGAGVLLGEIVLTAASAELRTALAEPLQARWRAESPPTSFLLELARAGRSPELQEAAGALLSERFLSEGTLESELFQLAGRDPSPAVRRAAARALEKLLIAKRLPEGALFGLVSRFTLAATNPASSPELATALSHALAERFLNPLLPVPDSREGGKAFGS